MKTTTVLDPRIREKMAAAEKSYSKMTKAALKEHVKRNCRVCDLKGADKWLLIGMLLRAEFGQIKLELFWD